MIVPLEICCAPCTHIRYRLCICTGRADSQSVSKAAAAAAGELE